MEVPMEIVFRDVERTPEIDRLIEKKVARLDRVCNNLISCRIAIEQPQKHQRQGNPYRVRIEMRIPPNPAKPEPNFILMGTRPLAKSSP
jgi:ribosome-associated translation inhibitor RaiA